MADSNNVRSWDAGRVAYGTTDLIVLGNDPDDYITDLAAGAIDYTDLDSFPVPFYDVGFHDVDQGLTRTRENNRTEHYGRGPLGSTLVRITKTRERHMFKFTALESSRSVQRLRYPGSTPESSGDITVTTVGPPASERWAWILDSYDGTVKKRTIVPNGEVVEWGEASENGDALEMVPLTVAAYAFDSDGNTFIEITNDPEMLEAS